MSRAYRVTWVSLSGNVSTSDTLTRPIEILPILAPARMAELLREELASAGGGWTRGDDGSMSVKVGDAVATLDAEATKLTVTADATGVVNERGASKTEAESALERGKEKLREHLGADLAKRLTDAEASVEAGLQAALQRVYVRALKEKAASMGTITSIDEGSEGPEGGGDHVITIKVRV